MRTIEAPDLLALWERGVSRHALDRSALLCAWARPELPPESIGDLPLGEITASVLRLRAACFGERIQAHVDCEGCGTRLQLSVSIDDLLRPTAGAIARDVAVAGARYRPPSLRDLSVVARERDPERAVGQLLERCLLERDSTVAVVLDDGALREVEDALEEADPNADLSFEVRCDACGHSGTAQLDAGELLWDDITARARTLLVEVHQLAYAYGWSETEILALSPERRASYLALVAP